MSQHIDAVAKQSDIDTLNGKMVNIDTASISPATGVTFKTIIVKKNIKTVTISGTVELNTALGSANLLFVLPNGFKPIESIYGVAHNRTRGTIMRGEISTSGGVYIYPTSNDSVEGAVANIGIAATYIVN